MSHIKTLKVNEPIKPGGLDSQMVGLIADGIRTSGEETTGEWLVSEGHATDMGHARELVASAKLKTDQN